MTPRDLLVLHFVEEAQPVTSAHVAALLSMSDDTARRRLRVLRDLGLLTVHLTAMHDPNRYTLARAARPLLARAFGGEEEAVRVRRGIARVNLPHHDGQVDLYVALRVATARSKRWSLRSFLFEGEVRRRTGAGAGTLVPDCVAVLDGADGRQVALAFEIDLGTENPSWFTTRKALPYSDLRAAGRPLMDCEDWRVAVAVPSERRRNRLALSAWEAGIDEGVLYFAIASEINDRNGLGDLWLTPRVAQDGTSARLVPESPLPSPERPARGAGQRPGIERESTERTVTTAVTVRHDGPGAGR